MLATPSFEAGALMAVLVLLSTTCTVQEVYRRTTTIPTTTRSVCRLTNGTILNPGQKVTKPGIGSCVIYECSSTGELSTLYGDCFSIMCYDPVQGSCCYECPNGQNCIIPGTNTVIPSGKPVYTDGLRCECPPQPHKVPGTWEPAHYTAICTEATTPPFTTTTAPISTPSQGCRLDNGTILNPGQSITEPGIGSCVIYECSSAGELMTGAGDCLSIMCFDPIQGPCCYQCPNGPNCIIPGTNTVIPAGKPVYTNGLKCECPPQDPGFPGTWVPEHYTAICTSTISTTTLSPKQAKRREKQILKEERRKERQEKKQERKERQEKKQERKEKKNAKR